MNVPEAAKLEAVLGGGLVIYDVSGILPVNSKSRHVYRRRNVRGIRYAIIHKSGADGPPGYRGAEGSARFVTRHRGWPGAAYTYWLSREPDLTEQGRVIYRCHADSVRSFHTGGRMNTLGVGIGVQGNYDGDGDGFADKVPTDFQIDALAGLVAHLEERHPRFEATRKLDQDMGWCLTGHWEHGKPVCPGDAMERWVRETRGELTAIAANVSRPAQPHEVDPNSFDVRQRQQALGMVEHSVGRIDGRWGFRSRAALEDFQFEMGLVIDGVWGKHTSAAMLGALRDRGASSASMWTRR
jgi:hypothetical protein